MVACRFELHHGIMHTFHNAYVAGKMYVYSTPVLDSASLLHECMGVGVTDKYTVIANELSQM